MTLRIPNAARFAFGAAAIAGSFTILSGTAMAAATPTAPGSAAARPGTTVPIGGYPFSNLCDFGPGDPEYAPNGDVVIQQPGQTNLDYFNSIWADPTSSGVTQATSFCVQNPTTGALYELSEQSDGNLVVYSTSGALWSSKSYTGPINGVGTELVLQSDGNLVQYQYSSSGQGNALWSTKTYPGTTTGGSDFTCFQTDGNLVVYAGTPTDAANPCYGPVLWVRTPSN